MGVQTTSSPSRRLEGLHGVHLSLYSPFGEHHHSHNNIHQTDYKVPGSLAENQQVVVSHLWQWLPAFMKPMHIHCKCQGDKTVTETVANVLTSLPFIAVGLQTPRKNLRCAAYGTSLIGVGITSSLYHCSRGNMRKILRWLDYTMIAAATICLSRALRNENQPLLMAASAFCLPYKPFLVSLVHTGLMEVSFAQKASIKPELKMSHNLHAMSSLLGGALFFADDYYPQTPYIHAAWHLAAALGAGTCNKLLECNER